MHIIHIDRRNIDAFRSYLPEKLAHSVVSEEIRILGAVDEHSQKMAGVLIYYTAEDQAELNWLFVEPEGRHQKYASRLMDTAINEMIQTDGLVRCVVEFVPEKTEGLEGFLDDHDFDLEDAELPSYEICINDLQLPDGMGKLHYGDDILNIKTLPADMKSSFARTIQDTYTLAAVMLPLEWKMFDQDLSIVAINNNEVHGAFLIDRTGDKLELAYGFASPDRPASFMELLGALISRLEEKYGRDRKVLVSAVTDEADELVKRLAPRVQKLKIRRAVLSLYG